MIAVFRDVALIRGISYHLFWMNGFKSVVI